MPRHDLQRVRRFAHGQVAFTALAIACCLRLIPGALRFIKHNDARFGHFMRMHHMMFQKAMHILQRGARGAFRCQKGRTALGGGIARQSFPQYCHQRHIAGKKGGACFPQRAKHKIEAAKRFARTRYARDKNHIAPAFSLGTRNHARNGIRGAGQIMRIGACGADIGHRITPIQKPRCLQHARHGTIGGTRPGIGVKWRPGWRDRRLRTPHKITQHGAISHHHRHNAVPK